MPSTERRLFKNGMNCLFFNLFYSALSGPSVAALRNFGETSKLVGQTIRTGMTPGTDRRSHCQRRSFMLLDGYPHVGYYTAFPLLARRFNRAGFNVATLVAPYNLQRRPRRPMEENRLEFSRAMAQGVAEIRALTGWLLDEGCPSVGLLGFSFGGWFAGLTACRDPANPHCQAALLKL